MARFCIHCGRPLQDGEICTCQSAAVNIQEDEEKTQILGAQSGAAASEPEAPAGSRSQADPIPQAGPGPQPGPRPQAGPGPQAGPRPQAGPGPQAGFGPRPGVYQQRPQGGYPGGYQTRPAPGMGARPADPALYPKNAPFFTKLGCLLQGAFKHPARMLKSFSASGDMSMTLTIMGIEAVLFGLFLVTVFSKIGKMLTDMIMDMSGMSGLTSYSDYSEMMGLSQMYDFPLVKIFFIGLITALVIMFAFAGLLFVFNKVLFKAHTGFAQMAGVSAARALAAMPFVLIGIIAALIDPFLGLSVYGFGTLLGYFFTATALKSCTVGNETKYIYILFLTFACMAIVNVLIIRLTYTWYLPDYIRMSMDSLNGLSGLFG